MISAPYPQERFDWQLIDMFNRTSANVDGTSPAYVNVSGQTWNSAVTSYGATYPYTCVSAGYLLGAGYGGINDNVSIQLANEVTRISGRIHFDSPTNDFDVAIRLATQDLLTNSAQNGFQLGLRRETGSTDVSNRIRKIVDGDGTGANVLVNYGDETLTIAETDMILPFVFTITNNVVSMKIGTAEFSTYDIGSDFSANRYLGIAMALNAGSGTRLYGIKVA